MAGSMAWSASARKNTSISLRSIWRCRRITSGRTARALNNVLCDRAATGIGGNSTSIGGSHDHCYPYRRSSHHTGSGSSVVIDAASG